MKTIAVSIDEPTLRMLDRLVSSRGRGGSRRARPPRSRSEIVRLALQEFLARREQREREQAEWEIWSRHLATINRDAAALVTEQAAS